MQNESKTLKSVYLGEDDEGLSDGEVEEELEPEESEEESEEEE